MGPSEAIEVLQDQLTRPESMFDLSASLDALQILRANVERKVDDEMVWRACYAYEHSDRTLSGTQHIESSEIGMRAALIAALGVEGA